MAVGDDAIAGQPEKIQIKTFPPDQIVRTIQFMGYKLSIYKDTNEQKTYIENNPATTEYEPYEVPVGYSVQVRGGTVYFEV